jgi:hypothetical protein
MKTSISLALVSFLVLARPAFADDRPLIWSPAKASDWAYTARMGIQLPVELKPAAGIDVGLVATEGGALVEAPVAAWGDVKLREAKGDAATKSHAAGARLNLVSGSASVTMNYHEKRIATSTFNIERRSSYTARYDGASGHWDRLAIDQTVRLTKVGTGSSLVADTSMANNFGHVSWALGVEQEVLESLTVKAAVRDASGRAKASATIRADVRFRW